MTRLEQYYRDTVAKDLLTQFSYKSVMQVPRITKVTLNMGVGEASQDKKVIDHAVEDLTLIAGQKPVVTIAKKAIACFKLREGMTIGCKVTLRREKMYEVLDRLIHFSIPRSGSALGARVFLEESGDGLVWTPSRVELPLLENGEDYLLSGSVPVAKNPRRRYFRVRAELDVE